MKLRNRLSTRTGETEALRQQLHPVLDEIARAITTLENRLATNALAAVIGNILVSGGGCTITVTQGRISISVP